MISSIASRTVIRRAMLSSNRVARTTTTTIRRWESTNFPKQAEDATVDSRTRLANIALASALTGFCVFVFTYSLNAVGKSAPDDPLAQLRAEAQEAQDVRMQQKAQRLTPEEIAALESGRTGGEDMEVAVAAPAEIAQLEEEALLLGKTQAQKKKPWWRFGF